MRGEEREGMHGNHGDKGGNERKKKVTEKEIS